MPKSSSAMRTPSFRSAARLRSVFSLSVITSDSVISRTSDRDRIDTRPAAPQSGPEARIRQLAGGQVDADLQVGPAQTGLLPPADLLARRAQNERVDFADETNLLGEGHEVTRIDEPPFGVGPPHQHLEPGQPVGLQVHHGLVVRDQVSVEDRRLQLLLQLHPGQHQRVHFVAVDLEAVLAQLLGLVHRDVGVAQELLAGDAFQQYVSVM